MSSPVDLVIFDCDGVLVDSESLAVRVESKLLADMGWSLTEAEIVDRFVGRSDSYMLGEIEKALGRLVPEWQPRYEEHLHAAFRSELAAVEGIHDALDQLTVPTCVASSGTHEKMRLTLSLTGLFERFDGRIYSATDVAAGKPAPDLFLHAAAQCGVSPARCVVVEDSKSGVEAARAAGMRSLAFAGGLTPAAILDGEGTIVFDRMSDLPGLLASIRQPSVVPRLPGSTVGMSSFAPTQSPTGDRPA